MDARLVVTFVLFVVLVGFLLYVLKRSLSHPPPHTDFRVEEVLQSALHPKSPIVFCYQSEGRFVIKDKRLAFSYEGGTDGTNLLTVDNGVERFEIHYQEGRPLRIVYVGPHEALQNTSLLPCGVYEQLERLHTVVMGYLETTVKAPE